MFLALVATLAIVVSDHASVRSTPRSTATELTTLWPGDVVEVRGEQAEYLKVYSYRRERGGYLRNEAVRRVDFTEAQAPGLLAVVRFLRDTPGSEALGISYGAAYLKAVPPKALTAEPFDAIAQMAERLADTASGNGSQAASVASRLEVVSQFGVRMRSFEHNGRMQVCYDGELFRRVLTQANATAEQRAQAALGLTRSDCIDPTTGPVVRTALDDERRELLDHVQDTDLTPMTRSRLRARRAVVWSAVTYEQARHGQQVGPAAQRALAELAGVRSSDLGEVHQSEYVDAALRVSAIRWAGVASVTPTGPATATLATQAGAIAVGAATPVIQAGAIAIRIATPATQAGAFAVGAATPAIQAGAIAIRIATPATQAGAFAIGAVTPTRPMGSLALGEFALTTAAAEPGQTCVTLEEARPQRVKATLARRCTFGIVWLASAKVIPRAPAVVLSVQPLESWRELWVFHQLSGKWIVDVLFPGTEDPQEGYVDFAGFAPGTSRILLVREVKERARFRRWFEEVRLDDMVLVRQASAPELLRDFGRWQDVRWRRETLALR